MDIGITQYKAKAKKGLASFCVDTRSAVANGERKFFKTNAEAKKYIEQLNAEMTPSSSNSWDWLFSDLIRRDKDGKIVGHYARRLQQSYEAGDISKSNKDEKERHALCLAGCKIDNKLIANWKVRDITHGHFIIQVVEELRINRSKKTIANLLGNVRDCFHFSILSGCRNTNPATGVKPLGKAVTDDDEEEIQRLSADLIDTIIGNMPTKDWAERALFASQTGLRQGEQRALLWSAVELNRGVNGCVHVQRAIKHRAGVGKTKTKKGKRTVPLNPGLKKMLQERYIASGRPSGDKPVFPGQRNPIASANGFIIAIHKACDAAGVAHIRWHDLRHYYASVLLDRLKNNWWQIQNLMGHQDITTTQQKYGHWLDNEARDDEISNAVAGGFKS